MAQRLDDQGLLQMRRDVQCWQRVSINWWTDIWYDEAPLCTQLPSIFLAARHRDRRVKECWGENGWQWELILDGIDASSVSLSASILQLKAEISTLAPANSCDSIRWRWSNSGIFTVKSAYKVLQDGGLRGSPYVRIWSIKVPLKVKIFVWLVLRGRVRTKENLSKVGWTGELHCTLCPDVCETIDHLFLTCPTTSAILLSLLLDNLSVNRCSTVVTLWDAYGALGGVAGKLALRTIAATWWTVWLERNRRCFEQKKQPLNVVLSEARSTSDLWGSCCP